MYNSGKNTVKFIDVTSNKENYTILINTIRWMTEIPAGVYSRDRLFHRTRIRFNNDHQDILDVKQTVDEIKEMLNG